MQFLFVHIDVALFLKRIGQRRDAMIQGDGTDGEHGLFRYGEDVRGGIRRDRANRLFTDLKSIRRMEEGLAHSERMELLHVDGERIPIDEIPRVAAELPLHIVDEPGRTEEP